MGKAWIKISFEFMGDLLALPKRTKVQDAKVEIIGSPAVPTCLTFLVEHIDLPESDPPPAIEPVYAKTVDGEAVMLKWDRG